MTQLTINENTEQEMREHLEDREAAARWTYQLAAETMKELYEELGDVQDGVEEVFRLWARPDAAVSEETVNELSTQATGLLVKALEVRRTIEEAEEAREKVEDLERLIESIT